MSMCPDVEHPNESRSSSEKEAALRSAAESNLERTLVSRAHDELRLPSTRVHASDVATSVDDDLYGNVPCTD